MLSVAQGVGAIAGGVTASAALRRFGDGRTLGVGVLLFAAGDALFLVPSLAPVLVGFAVGGAGLSWAVVSFGTAIQLRTPADLQGRVYSAADMVLGTPQTLSIALGAALITIVDYRFMIVVIGVSRAPAACSWPSPARPTTPWPNRAPCDRIGAWEPRTRGVWVAPRGAQRGDDDRVSRRPRLG